MSQEQEVVAAFFQLVDSLLRAAPGVLLPAEQLPTFMTWACASLRVCPLGCAAAAPRAAPLDLDCKLSRLFAVCCCCKATHPFCIACRSGSRHQCQQLWNCSHTWSCLRQPASTHPQTTR